MQEVIVKNDLKKKAYDSYDFKLEEFTDWMHSPFVKL